jgi:N-sulfoglucosamine sulfohydrolase
MTNTGKATLALIALACLSVQNLYSQDTRPDIVLLLADDWEFPHATPYGDRVVDTRVFDNVAAEGMLFTRAYSAAPHSSPSRASILKVAQEDLALCLDFL